MGVLFLCPSEPRGRRHANTRCAFTHPQRLEPVLRTVAHSRRSHVSARGLGENIHSLQTHMDKQKCTQARTQCTLSPPNLCNRAAPPHNTLFIKSRTFQPSTSKIHTGDDAKVQSVYSPSETTSGAKEYTGGGQAVLQSPLGPGAVRWNCPQGK